MSPVEVRVLAACQPIESLLKALGYPVASVMILSGFILVTAGQPQKGWQFIRYAVIGFIGIQFVPVFMRLLIEVAGAMAR